MNKNFSTVTHLRTVPSSALCLDLRNGITVQSGYWKCCVRLTSIAQKSSISQSVLHLRASFNFSRQLHSNCSPGASFQTLQTAQPTIISRQSVEQQNASRLRSCTFWAELWKNIKLDQWARSGNWVTIRKVNKVELRANPLDAISWWKKEALQSHSRNSSTIAALTYRSWSLVCK